MGDSWLSHVKLIAVGWLMESYGWHITVPWLELVKKLGKYAEERVCVR